MNKFDIVGKGYVDIYYKGSYQQLWEYSSFKLYRI